MATSTLDVCEACDLELEPEQRAGPRRRYCCEACRKFAARNPGWQAEAACADPDIDPNIFFSARGQSATPAREVCDRCPVREPCLDHALQVADDAGGMHFGVFGGMTPNQRRRHVRQRRTAA